MILWDKTKEQFGYDKISAKSKSKLVVACDNCKTELIRISSSYKQKVKKNGKFLCHNCATKSTDFKEQCSIRARQLWQDDSYIKNNLSAVKSDEYRQAKSIESKKRWQDANFRAKMMTVEMTAARKVSSSKTAKILWKDPKYRTKLSRRISDRMLKRWKQEGYREFIVEVARDNTTKLWEDGVFNDSFGEEFCGKMQIINKAKWQDEEYRQKMAVVLLNQPRVSSIQTILYSILDDLGVRYFREHDNRSADVECLIGPWTFDCVIPRENKTTLLIECQGDYWHSRKDRQIRDQQKSSYITNNLLGQYELKYLWEHEFLCQDKIKEILKYWLGLNEPELINFSFNDIQIKITPALDYKPLLGKYHYLPNAGRGGIVYGAYLKNELIAVCAFSPLIRQNISIPGYDAGAVRELSRLCLHPKYRKKNFLSWFVSSCLKALDDKFKCVISYCDTTFNHTGAIYKACNFKLDGEISPDYWYVSDDGWIMHKRTLYGHAIKMQMTEKVFAEKYRFKQVWGQKKLRFRYDRD